MILCLLQKLKNLLSWQRKLRQTLCHPRQLILLLLLHVVHLLSFRCGFLLEGGVFSLVTFCCWCWCGFWCAVDSGSGSGSSWYLLVSQQCKCRSSSSSSSLLLLPLLCLFAVCSAASSRWTRAAAQGADGSNLLGFTEARAIPDVKCSSCSGFACSPFVSSCRQRLLPWLRLALCGA